MIAYIYYKDSKIISCKIDNIEYINDSDKEIKGQLSSIKYGDGQDYICLENDTINLNVGNVINLDGLVDSRDYFVKGKDYWYQEQIKQHQQIINNLQNNLKSNQSTINSLTDTIVELSCNITIS